MTVNNGKETKEYLMYTEYEIKGMKEAWFWVGCGSGTLITIIMMTLGLHFFGNSFLQ